MRPLTGEHAKPSAEWIAFMSRNGWRWTGDGYEPCRPNPSVVHGVYRPKHARRWWRRWLP